MGVHVKDLISHVNVVSTDSLNVISPCLLLFLPFFVGPGCCILPCVFTLHGSFQLTHSVSVIRQIRRSKITMTVVLILPGQQAYFQRWKSLIALLGAELINIICGFFLH